MADKYKVERKGERLTEPDWLTGCTCAAWVVSAIRPVLAEAAAPVRLHPVVA
jgi:hypothetical protein